MRSQKLDQEVLCVSFPDIWHHQRFEAQALGLVCILQRSQELIESWSIVNEILWVGFVFATAKVEL